MSPSQSARFRDGNINRYEDLAATIRDLPPKLGAVRLVAVDGPGGAGKSTFAERLAQALGGVPVIHTDDFASWETPLEWWDDLERYVLGPLARGETARFESYDWLPRRPRGRQQILPADVVILEGVSSARREVRDRVSMTIWIDTPPDVRLGRGLARDGEEALPAWEVWSAEEGAHFAADATAERADLVVKGAPTVPHDPELEFVCLRG